MSRRQRMWFQLTVFLAIALTAVGWVAVRYVGVLRTVGAQGYVVHLELPSSGGLFDAAEVTYRGVPVGRVHAMRLTPTGVEVDLAIASSSTRIPRDLHVDVANRSVIGEEYVDLVPATDAGPYLAHGDTIPVSETTLPTSTTDLLTASDDLLESIPVDDLRTTVSELSTAFANGDTDLQRLLVSSQSFFSTATAQLPTQQALLDAGAQVLATQNATAASIKGFSSSLKLFSAQVKSSDGDLRTLFAVTPGTATVLQQLFSDLDPSLGVLLANLTTTSTVVSADVGGLQTVLALAPQAIGVGDSVFTANGVDAGLALTFFNPLPCTDGYAGTTVRSPLDTTPGAPLNTAAGCRTTTAATTGPALAVPGTATSTSASSLADLLGGQG